MSEQYQRFKQNFFRQHPPSSPQQNNTFSTSNKTFKQYDPYSEYTSGHNNTYHNQQDGDLRIDNETHFPFEEIQQTTFQDFENDPFLSHKLNQQKNFSQKLEQSDTKNYHYDNDMGSYEMMQNNSVKQVPNRTESHLEFRTLQKSQLSQQDNYLKTQQSGIDKINKQIDKLRVTRQQNISQQPSREDFYVNEYQQKLRNPVENGFTQHSYQVNRQYVVQNSRNNNLLPVSPPKQLPVIYNRPNSTSNSQHKVNPPPSNSSNSRVLIQQSPLSNQGPVFLSPPQNSLQPIQPVIINHSQQNNFPPQNIGSRSRVIIQSETVGQSKGIIQSSQNIHPTPGYIIQQQPLIVNSPPKVQFDSQNRVVPEGMISIKEYERLKTECSMWQQKFYQTNDQLTKLQSQRGGDVYGNGFSQQTILLKEENTRLMEKIRTLQNSEKNSFEKIKTSYEELMKKYQGSLMKEADLLIDRFRLQMKHNERY